MVGEGNGHDADRLAVAVKSPLAWVGQAVGPSDSEPVPS